MKSTAQILAVLAAALTGPALGNGFRLVSQDAFAAARGEAFVATADNPSAVHYNPAGLTQIEGDEVRMGLYALHFDPSYQAPAGAPNAGRKYEIETQDAFAPQLYATGRFPDTPITFGLGVYSPHGASVTWPEDTGFRAVATEGQLTYLRVNPVIAAEVAPGLSLAAGVMIDYADIGLEQGLLRTAAPFFNSFRFDGSDVGLGYNLGALWRINEQWSIGSTFRSSVTMDFEGRTTVLQRPFIRETEVDASAEFEFPYTAVIGVSYRPTKDWNLEFDADYSNWSCIDRVVIRQERTPPFPVQRNIPVTLRFKDSWMLKLGATRSLADGWYASAGYLFNENSVLSDYYSPTVADLDRHFLTLGVGRKWSDYTVDVAYQFGYGPDRTVSGSTAPATPGRFVGQNADGTYGFVSHGLLVSVGMKF